MSRNFPKSSSLYLVLLFIYLISLPAHSANPFQNRICDAAVIQMELNNCYSIELAKTQALLDNIEKTICQKANNNEGLIREFDASQDYWRKSIVQDCIFATFKSRDGNVGQMITDQCVNNETWNRKNTRSFYQHCADNDLLCPF